MLRLELVREVVDEAPRHLYLLRPDLHVLLQHIELGGPDLVRPEHRLEDEDAVLRPQGAEVFLFPEGHLGQGDPAILEKICRAFRIRLPDHLAAVREALRERDAPRLREAAHKLAGMIAAFSTVAGGVASDLEDHAARGQLDEATALVERLETMSQELVRLAGGLTLESLQRQAETGADRRPAGGR